MSISQVLLSLYSCLLLLYLAYFCALFLFRSDAGLPSAAIMFSKKKKTRIDISAPSNFEHRVHTDFDEQEQKFVGLPRQWQSLIEDTAKRPKPFIDATVITTVEPHKVDGVQSAVKTVCI